MPENTEIAVLGGLPVAQFEACLDALDAEQGQVRRPTRDADLSQPGACFRFRGPRLSLEIRNPAGGVRRLTGLPRMIHVRGLAVMHTGFVFPQSPAEVLLPTIDGESIRIKACVEACRHVVAIVHETTLAFVPDIDLRRHLGLDEPAEADAAAPSR